ncbi:hypothetical protein BDK51DRAFT_26898 [Blyttiomyces helicus]|uniref:Uncharacterized protein n=1 Tax=Blyttiomyces helicus TaxID=388810 RepID=A0A4P9WNK7_9FUNG|nr:hypothetical protein BDK51DRAFT_26898 [Blyttiomyces helicus]|eukprot:RKO94554.1 hypothetical protein BDK51DRAFT_26898 [Blyttiomyces helicus]
MRKKRLRLKPMVIMVISRATYAIVWAKGSISPDRPRNKEGPAGSAGHFDLGENVQEGLPLNTNGTPKSGERKLDSRQLLQKVEALKEMRCQGKLQVIVGRERYMQGTTFQGENTKGEQESRQYEVGYWDMRVEWSCRAEEFE